MNREIKFRAWDTRRKVWNYTLFEFDVDGILELTEPGIICQFTGLLDKNGKDIYEGDVIIVGNKRAIVTFDNACFRTKIGVSNYRLGGWKKIEVIGNIYENKEQLTP